MGGPEDFALKETISLALLSGNLKILICFVFNIEIFLLFIANIMVHSRQQNPDWLQSFKEPWSQIYSGDVEDFFPRNNCYGRHKDNTWDFQSSFRKIIRRNQAWLLSKGRACCHTPTDGYFEPGILAKYRWLLLLLWNSMSILIGNLLLQQRSLKRCSAWWLGSNKKQRRQRSRYFIRS